MSTQTFNAQTRIPKVLMTDLKRKLDSSGMTISEYLRNLIMIDLGKFPINIPKVRLDSEQEKRILEEIKGSSSSTVLATNKDIDTYINSLSVDD